MNVQGLEVPPRPHVYPVREDTLLLAQAISVHPGERFLEVGCGNGLSSLAAALAGAKVLAADRNPFAVRAVDTEARRRGLTLDVVRTDLQAGLGKFDVIACNPPYLPTRASQRDPDPWQNLALDGGPDGRAFVRKFLRDLPFHLQPRGRAYLLVASLPESPVRTPGLPVPAPGLRVVDLVGDRSLPGETLWVLELAREDAPRPAGGG